MYFHSASVASQLDFNSESAANNGTTRAHLDWEEDSWKTNAELRKERKKKNVPLMFHCNLLKRIVTLVRINRDREGPELFLYPGQ